MIYCMGFIKQQTKGQGTLRWSLVRDGKCKQIQVFLDTINLFLLSELLPCPLCSVLLSAQPEHCRFHWLRLSAASQHLLGSNLTVLDLSFSVQSPPSVCLPPCLRLWKEWTWHWEVLRVSAYTVIFTLTQEKKKIKNMAVASTQADTFHCFGKNF